METECNILESLPMFDSSWNVFLINCCFKVLFKTNQKALRQSTALFQIYSYKRLDYGKQNSALYGWEVLTVQRVS